MDDMLVSVETEEEARLTCQEVEACLRTGGFELAKWVSNAPAVLNNASDTRAKAIDDNEDVSVLGLVWDPAADRLRFKVALNDRVPPLTKRLIASDGARIFDPNGYLAPITISAKLFMQNLWRIGVEWDEQLNEDITNGWQQFYQGLKQVADISIPRWLGTTTQSKTQLHVFCDASLKAYGAVVYARTTSSDNAATTALITAKSKVADLQSVNIPRMELSAAHLGAKLATRVADVLQIPRPDIHYWSDSEVVLHWLAKFPSDLKVFVGNRVAQIQALTRVKNWRHVPTTQNPADLISRSTTVNDLRDSTLWWHGPNFLQLPSEKWPAWNKATTKIPDQTEVAAEERKPVNPYKVNIITYAGSDNHPVSLIAKYKCLAKVVRITAYYNRAIAIWRRAAARHRETTKPGPTGDTEQPGTAMTLRKRKARPARGHPAPAKRVMITTSPYELPNTAVPLTRTELRIKTLIASIAPVGVEEYRTALKYWVSKTQQKHYKAEIAALRRGDPQGNTKTKHLDGVKTSKIGRLSPFIDAGNLIRARGRIERASLTYDQRHPIIIPKESLLAQRLIKEAHDRTQHGGTQACIQYVRDVYWVQGLRPMTQRYIRGCMECEIRRKNMGVQLMADLPKARITPSNPFAHCGVDLAGPFKLTAFKGRGTKVALNAYTVVFVCFASRAVHLELVSDLSSATFLAALDRAIARRPHIRHLYSDNGTNFVGAARELRENLQAWHASAVANELTLKQITWHFNTPLAPHHGGLWEAAVKSLKHHLSHVIDKIALTFEEMYTVLVRIEACLNSRPIAALNDDPTDLTMLTPGHLATGAQIITPMPPVPEQIPTSGRINWKTIRALEADIWERWQADYLPTLQLRNKWTAERPNLAVGDFVVINDRHLPPAQWRKGRIKEILPGPDGLVRSVIVKTAAGEYQRPITRICVLPTATPEDEPADDLAAEAPGPA